MREYAVVSPRFWTGRTGRLIRKAGLAARVVAAYLITGPQANALGLYYLPLPYVAHETGLGVDEAAEALAELERLGFCRFDPGSEFVWVLEMARWQLGGRLKSADNRVRFVTEQYRRLLDNPFLGAFYDRYADDLNLPERRADGGAAREAGAASPKTRVVPAGQGACEGLSSQDQEQEGGGGVSRGPVSRGGAAAREAAFDALWAAYPVRRDEARARRAWRLAWKADPELPDAAELVRIVAAFATGDWEWRRGKIPRLARFIAEGLWREAPIPAPGGPSGNGGGRKAAASPPAGERRELAKELLRELDHGQ